MQTVYCHGIIPPPVSGRHQSRLYCHGLTSPPVLGRHQSRVYCHGIISPSVSGRQQSMQTVYCHGLTSPQSEADTSPDCVLPWSNITLILRQTTVQTVYCHGLTSPSVSGRQQSRLCTAMTYHHPQSQADNSPDCVLP